MRPAPRTTTIAGPAPLATVSVVICAYTLDRWDDLVAAYASVSPQLTHRDEIVLVIDHNPDLFVRARSLERARVLESDGGRGLSGARNTGVRAGRGDVVAFLDDDAVARPGWLESVRAAFARPDVMVLGTGVEPAWAGGAAPGWFPAEFNWVVGCSYRGLPTTRSAIRNPIGASMAIRRTAFTAVGGFAEEMGRIGALPAGCEETEFCVRLATDQPAAHILYDPGCAVDHRVPEHRQTLRYFVRRCFHEGRSKRSVARLRGASAGLSAERRYVRVVLPVGVLRCVGAGVVRVDRWALARAATIVLGFAATVSGYLSAARRPAGRPAYGKSRRTA
jgi:glucosyl-dolichyl phosphate glucuronosyltransferase